MGRPRPALRARTSRTALAVAGLIALLGAACSKNPTSPANEPVLSGTVLDALGRPVADARIEISYPYAPTPAPSTRAEWRGAVPVRPGSGPSPAAGLEPVPIPVPSPRSFSVTGNPCSLGAVTVQFGLPLDAQVRGGVLTRGGVTVRTLMNQTLPAGLHRVSWDGLDDSTVPVPADLYRVLLTEVQGDSTFTFSADVLWNSSDPTAAHQLTADPDGRFFIALSQLPVGLTVHAVSSDGTDLGDFKIGGLIRVSATGPPGGSTGVGSTTITYGGGSASVVVRLP